MHNLLLTEDQDLVVDTVRKFAADVVAPRVQELDEHRTFVREFFDGLAELGVFGLTVGEQHGGAGMGLVPYVAALEAVGAHSGSLARLWIGQAQVAAALEAVGDSRLDDVLQGSRLATYVGAENRVMLQGEQLSGRVELQPAAEQAELFVVAATEGNEPVLVALDASAVERSARRTIGLASCGCAALTIKGPAVIMARGEVAAAAIQRAELMGLLGVAAATVGGGEGAAAAARKHAAERIAFGKPLLAQQAVQRKLVDCRHAIAAARQLTWHAARLNDQQPAIDAVLHARLAAVDAMVRTADEAIQIHGGFGYTVEYHVERHYRDAVTFDVLDGGSGPLRDRLASLQFQAV